VKVSNAKGRKRDTGHASDSRVSLFENVSIVELGSDLERAAHAEGFRFVAGIDEVGRGCLAGPVVAAACILDLSQPLPDGLDDSKKVAPDVRERVGEFLRTSSIAFAVGRVEAEEIDRINILEATKKAMFLALEALTPSADYLLIDALELKGCGLPQRSVIKGDSISVSIAAASIIAKTHRDALMREYHLEFPEYGFESHKGYGCASHYAALRDHGPCPLHRKTFRGVLQDTEPAEGGVIPFVSA
jgi:ribonuclease HII